jgi:hypothetical protein
MEIINWVAGFSRDLRIGLRLLGKSPRRPDFGEAGPASVYFKPSFFPAASIAIDSRMRLSRVSSRLAI